MNDSANSVNTHIEEISFPGNHLSLFLSPHHVFKQHNTQIPSWSEAGLYMNKAIV